MDPSEINNFEDQWKKAFNEASETPPPSVWEGIEARLDRDENNIIPLWWRSPKLWYAAASIAALLLVGGGLWYTNMSGIYDKNGVEMAAKKPSSGTEIEQSKTEKSIEGVDIKDENKSLIASSTTKPEHAVENGKSKTFTRNSNGKQKSNHATAGNESEIPEKQLATNEISSSPAMEKDKINSRENLILTNADQILKPVDTTLNEDKLIADSQARMSEMKLITPITYSELEVYMQKRYVFFKAEQKEQQPLEAPRKQKEYFAGIGLMPGTFNPDVQIKTAPQTFANMQSSRQKSLTGTSKAGNSLAIQTQGGMRLSKHWSLEMGLSYLKGNSKYEGGGYVLDALSSRKTNVLEDAVNGLYTSKNPVPNSPAPNSPGVGAGAESFVTGNSLYFDVNKNVNNNYQFLQLPVQAGFTLNADKKLSYSVLGGMMANFFLSNELESASGEIITTIASDEVYKSTNWAATTGLRFNYKLSSKWKANLTGSYQKAISSGFKTNQSMESRPYLYGVSWGVRYSF